MMNTDNWKYLKRGNVNPVKGFEKQSFFWHKTNKGNLALVFEYDKKDSWDKKNKISGEISVYLERIEKRFRIIITLKNKEFKSVFSKLCEDVLSHVINANSEEKVCALLYSRLIAWQNLFRKNSTLKLSIEKQMGLIGELYFLKEYLLNNFEHKECLNFWTGADPGKQDFVLNRSSIEVKSKKSSSSNSVQISSLDQLSSKSNKLYLYVVTLNPASNSDAITLNILVESISDILNDLKFDFLNTLLDSHRYIKDDSYDEHKYLIMGEEFFNVTEKFPKITRASIPVGIDEVKYKISLSHCQSFLIEKEHFLGDLYYE